MTIALAVEKESFDSELSDVFGRCKYLLIYNSKDQSKKMIPNPFSSAFDGAGIQTSQLLIENDSDVLIVTNIGDQALIFLESVEIKVYKSPKEKALKAITLFNEGKLEEAKSQNEFVRGRRKRYRQRGKF
ncbi:MAG: NifB/NifX family molybdenum-iron cluster-binding protein [Melioribacteraceae bacterium]|nr:NifB/NifX family molybdenum-iron cluster-binding protein [Melioribacteraceae bacterium]